ncbi:MAG: carboxylesterase/lipase family protein [Dehalococcoidales bacterium]
MSKKQETVIETKSGKIEGSYEGGLYVFKGIPYAAPPVGERRWLPPQPVEPWRGVRQAKTFGTIAPQNVMEIKVMQASRVEEPQSEDCLYLNIWSPGLDDARRPVLVWIHGGAFVIGSGSQAMHAGDKLAAYGDVVVVTTNYRLGLLGFLNLNEVTGGKIPATGNEGLLDQIAALEWVRDNIAAFGGDPDNVTVFGESAGGMSIGCLLAMPKARGLFQKAILESGVGSTVAPLEAAVMVAGKFLEVFGSGASDVEALRAFPVERLLSASLELQARMAREGEALRTTVTVPVIDGKALPELPINAIGHGSADKVTVLAGTNLEEWTLLSMMDVELPKLDEAGLVRRLQDFMPTKYIPGLIEAYREARVKRGADASPPALFRAVQTDRMFRIPCIHLVEAQRRHNQSTYNYLFTWLSPAMGGILGACHALDIGFVFGTLDASFHGSGPAVDRLSRNMQDAWVSFARTGNPSCGSIGNWPPYEERRVTMILGEDCHTEEAPYDEERRAWDSIPNVFTGEIRTDK